MSKEMLIELIPYIYTFICNSGRRDCMVIGFTTGVKSVPITTIVVSLNPADGKVDSMQHYKFLSQLSVIIHLYCGCKL